MKRTISYQALLVIICGILSACTSFQVDHTPPVSMGAGQRVAVLPFANFTETPQADDRAQSIATNLLRSHGFKHVVMQQRPNTKLGLIPGIKAAASRQQLLHWARQLDAKYALYGSVTEWSYKVGLDGEPVVGINLELLDVGTDRVIWSAVGSKSGGSRTALSDTAIVLIDSMLSSVHSDRVV
jgi:TolB-like protein